MSSPTTFKFDEEVTQTLEELKKTTKSSSKAEVLRRAIRLLQVAEEARANGEKLMITDSRGGPVKEIIIA